MKLNKHGLFVLTCVLGASLALASPGAAQTPPGLATLVSARDGTVSQVVTSPPLTLHDVLGKKGLNVDLRAFSGVNLSDAGRPGAGVAVSFRRDISRELFADLGVYGRTQQDRKLDGGFFVSVGWRL
ncbi:MAG: hypothetical protein ACO1SV_21700 [Fimbriimonas sp.]